MNSMKTVDMNEKIEERSWGMLTQLLLFALTIYQINAVNWTFTLWSDMQITLFTYSLIYMETLEIEEYHGTIKGIYLQHYPYLSC